jgi:hypothetical protein
MMPGSVKPVRRKNMRVSIHERVTAMGRMGLIYVHSLGATKM